MKEKLKKIAQLQKESAELLADGKTSEAIAKMSEAQELTDAVADETAAEPNTEEKEEIEKTAKENIKKWADAYINGSDFKEVLKQIIEASDMFKEVEAIQKTLEKIDVEKINDAIEVIEKIADEELASTSVDPWKEEIEKTKKDGVEVWDSLGI